MNTLSGPIAYLTGEYPRATDTFIQREVAGLRALGIKVETCSIRKTGPEHIVGPEQVAEQASTFHVLKTVATWDGVKHHARALKAPGRYFRALRLAWKTAPKGVKGRLYNLIYFAEGIALAAHMQEKGVVHLHNHIAKASCTVAMIASEISGIPYSFTLHGPDIFFAPDHWRLDEKIKRASFVACISDFCRSQAMLFSDRSEWNKLHIVHCGIEPEKYVSRRGKPGQSLLFIGRLAGVKGVPVLLEALAAARQTHPRMQLTLIGDGPERKELEAEADALGLKNVINFAGYLSQSEVAAALGAADALVLPSFAEGVPVVLMEAMAAGIPVVATRVGGVAELVEDGVSGRTIAPGDPVQLALAIMDVLEKGAEMGAAGRKKVMEEFNINNEVAWLAHLFSTASDSSHRPGKRP